MKIEKINDNQIRCTLTKEDLADRQIKLSELAYGSEKAKTLFRDMMQQANYEFGFEANDIPLMVEAIPQSSETIILVITKVEYPEEMDTRFSKFSEPGDDLALEEGDIANASALMQGADDILGLFRKIREERENDSSKETENIETSETTHSETVEKKAALQPEVMVNLTKMFEFRNLEQVERLANVLSGYYKGVNTLYKNPQKNRYYLLIKKSAHTPEEFNKVCNMISEYAVQRSYTPSVGAYFQEHGKLIVQDQALQIFAQL